MIVYLEVVLRDAENNKTLETIGVRTDISYEIEAGMPTSAITKFIVRHELEKILPTVIEKIDEHRKVPTDETL